MYNVACFSNQDRQDLFTETSQKLHIHQGIIEKDFWVCWILSALFTSKQWHDKLIFKGGTSLSKVFRLISRFSEDIDLILDWRLLGYTDDDLWKDRSNTQKDKFCKEVNQKNAEFIRANFVPSFKAELDAILKSDVKVEFDGESVNISYPKTFSTAYVLPVIRLEIGPLAAWVPHAEFQISSYAAEVYPKFFTSPSCTVTTTMAERTFWEKATILHQQAMRGYISPHYSRHYYDLAQMVNSNVKNKA
ncbi:MAG: nucleotidyl transferase AbiEii/AbiGii toxin family protein [Fibrobacter sp.]|mgnify:CR=1 FL=1|nr:nucleotidyl transferase AbiEii/AbiGii toxin family protein [Fibrobacter sp.]